MNLKNLKYGYYKFFNAGDGSMYDHCTAYSRSEEHYTIFAEDSSYYYDVLDNNKAYKKDAEYGETLVTITHKLSDLLPNCIDSDREYTLDEILSLMPRVLVANLFQEKQKQKQNKKVL